MARIWRISHNLTLIIVLRRCDRCWKQVTCQDLIDLAWISMAIKCIQPMQSLQAMLIDWYCHILFLQASGHHGMSARVAWVEARPAKGSSQTWIAGHETLTTSAGLVPSISSIRIKPSRNGPMGFHLGLSENSVPLHPMVNDHYPY